MTNPQTVKPPKLRAVYLAVGIFAMLFSGVLYAWSILKVPFSEQFGWSESALALNFTLTMTFFCLGAFAGSLICKRIGPTVTLIISAVLVAAGFGITAFLTAELQMLLYIGYALLAGTGIGISYNVVVSTVSAWFPDKRGLCSGCLMMGFGFSTLLLGNLITVLFAHPAIGRSKTFLLLGGLLALVLVLSGLILRRPSADTVFPAAKAAKSAQRDRAPARDYTTAEMLRSFSYWRAFFCLVFITAAGNSVISFARDLVLSVGAAPALAATLVGVLAVCNGLGRVLTGAVFDALGRRITMISANILTIVAAAVTLLAVQMSSLPFCIVGLCLTGLSYGSSPTVSSAFTAEFYGQKYFPVNYSITNFNLIGAALIAGVSNSLRTATDGYIAPFIMLLVLAVCALGLNFSVKKP